MRRFIDLKISLGSIVTLISMLMAIVTMWNTMGDRVLVLETAVAAQQKTIVEIKSDHKFDVREIEKELGILDDRDNDFLVEISGLKSTLSHNTSTLNQILQAVERRPR